MGEATTIFQLAKRPWFLPEASPYKIWIYPLTNQAGSSAEAAELRTRARVRTGTHASQAVVGMLVQKELVYSITPSGGWGPFLAISPPRVSQYLQLAQGSATARSIWKRIKDKGTGVLGAALKALGRSKDQATADLSALGTANKAAAVGMEFFTEQVYSGGTNYLSIQGLEMLFTTHEDARADVYAPLVQLSSMVAQRTDDQGFIYAPWKVAIRIGHYDKPIFKLDRAVIHSVSIKMGFPMDPDGFPTWGTASFTVESAQVVSDRLIKEAFRQTK
jgi:hypothetical protein